MRSNDLVSKFFYVLLASFAAPVWEEAIFRASYSPPSPPSSTPERRCSSLPPSSPSPTSPSSNFSPSRSSDVSCASSLCAPETSSPPRSCTAPGTCGFSSETSSHLSPSSFQPCSPRVYNDKKINRALPHRSHRLSPLSFAPGLSPRRVRVSSVHGNTKRRMGKQSQKIHSSLPSSVQSRHVRLLLSPSDASPVPSKSRARRPRTSLAVRALVHPLPAHTRPTRASTHRHRRTRGRKRSARRRHG